MNDSSLEVLSDAELDDVVGGADVARLLGMCGCGNIH